MILHEVLNQASIFAGRIFWSTYYVIVSCCLGGAGVRSEARPSRLVAGTECPGYSRWFRLHIPAEISPSLTIWGGPEPYLLSAPDSLIVHGSKDGPSRGEAWGWHGRWAARLSSCENLCYTIAYCGRPTIVEDIVCIGIPELVIY